MRWVVRGGLATPDRLIAGYDLHRGVPGLYGFSVQYAPGVSIDDLARAGRIRNGRISYADEAALESALQPLGYKMRLIPSPGHGYHHTFAVLYDVTGIMLQVLPQDAANALSQVFQQRPNPYKVP